MRVIVLAAIALGGCGAGWEDRPPLPLEVGVNDDGTFLPLSDGDPMALVQGVQGLDMIQPCLRAVGAAPTRPLVDVHASVEGQVMLAAPVGDRVDLEPDGIGNVLWDLRVVTSTQPCCLIGRSAHIDASLRDAKGQRFETELDVVLVKDASNPAPSCCYSVDDCPAPLVARLCE